jgi:hypothetical protein
VSLWKAPFQLADATKILDLQLPNFHQTVTPSDSLSWQEQLLIEASPQPHRCSLGISKTLIQSRSQP